MTHFIIFNLVTLIICAYVGVQYVKQHSGFYDCEEGRLAVRIYAAFQSSIMMLISIVVSACYVWGTFEAIEYSAEFAVKYIY